VARRLLRASAWSVAGAAVCYLLMIQTVLGQRFDQAADLGALGESHGVITANQAVLQRITGDAFAVVLLVLVGVGVFRRRPLLGTAAAFAAGVAVVATDVLKLDVLPQPNLVGMGTINTFPSGHTATAVGCAMAAVLVCPQRWRGVAALVAGGYGAVTSAEVQTAGWHKPSDAIGAAFLAFAAVTAAAGGLAWLRPVERSPGGSAGDRRRSGWISSTLAVLATVGGLVTLAGLTVSIADVIRHPRVNQNQPIWHPAYLTGLALTAEVVLLLLIALLDLLDGYELDGPRRHLQFGMATAGERRRSRWRPGPGTAR
jgi:membrane-associated phospholipid phosphatase